jgi:serine/threonine protein kinase/tetratricopeptide (TPR) repeat protein
MIGQTISHYRIIKKLGQGGMGVVYKARDTHLDRFVAIKVLPPEAVADPERKRRFVQEAKAASALNHPNIVTVHDIDQSDGIDFIAMEYIEGRTLDELIRRKGLKLSEALKYAVQIADALAKAHAAGIIHRDLKPGNVIVTSDGRAKVLDFGLAKLTEVAAASPDEETRTDQQSTVTGMIIGTAGYMSPEQAEGRKVDARSDIFSFGSVLYEMLTGRRAFRGENPALTLAAVLRSQPQPLGPKAPHDLEKVVERCLRKDPDRRYQTMADLKVALQDLKEESDSGKLAVPHAPSRPRSRAFLGSVPWATAALALAAIGFFLWPRLHAAPLTDKDVLVLADFTNTTGETVFDGTLREALAVQLEQSPFLKILSDGQVRQDLRFMGHPAGERITNQVAREICQREGEKAMIGGAIVSLGKSYAITLQATNCQTGETLAREQVEAGDKEHVLRAVATATARMRAKLGESLASIQKLAGPSEQVTTMSLDAFQAYALGRRQQDLGLSLEAIPFYRRATDLDPNFATAYNLLGVMYCNAGEYALCFEYRKKAFSLVDRVSEGERLAISAGYYRQTGELNKAAEQYELRARAYPRAYAPHNDLGIIYWSTGEWEKALAEYQEAARLEPRTAYPQSNQVGLYRCLERFDEARAVAEKLVAQKLDSPSTHVALLQVAYVQGDQAEAEKQIQWLAGKQEEHLGIEAQASNAVVLGQYRRAMELLERGGEMARRRNLAGVAARFRSAEAEGLALGGNCKEAREKARVATPPDPGPSDTLTNALPLAICGDETTAQKMVEDTSKRYPLHTLWKAVWRPAILAAVELNRNQPEQAIELLRSASAYERPYEFAVYLRGLAYLRLQKGAEAAAEFQSILDHNGANWGAYYPVSYVGLARAAAVAGDIPRARKAYQDFLTLWKDADPDIPILKEAKAEYAKLQ